MPVTRQARATMFGLVHHAHSYGRVAGHLADPLYRRVAADVAAALPPNARILDVGTGPGLLPLRLAADRPDLVIDAVDLAPEMIERARLSAATADLPGQLTFTVADVAALPFADATFDLVVSTISQHHWTEPAAGLSEVRRILRPGAEGWIYDFRWSLRRPVTAARTISPLLDVTRQSPLPGASWLNPIGRLIVRP